MPKKESELELSQRAERITKAIAYLESQKAEIERNELVAPVGCYVARYQARGQKYRY
jgi:multidrug resistance efflux pump